MTESHVISTDALLRLLQITSPALPIGAFAYSHGLEVAVARGWVIDAESAAVWIDGLLTTSLGSCDVPSFARIYRAMAEEDDARARFWNDWLFATRGSAELAAEDQKLGGALGRVLASLGVRGARVWGENRRATYAGLFALAARAFDVPLETAVTAYLFVFIEGQVGAAVKLVPLGQTEGQRILSTLQPGLAQAVRDGLSLEDGDMTGSLARHVMASALHETLYSRLFRS